MFSLNKTLVISLFCVFASLPIEAWSCPFDEAGIEVTILAHNEISKAVKAGDFEAASQKIIKQKELYEYFEKQSREPLYQPLLDASNEKNTGVLLKLLDKSLVLEIHELLDEVDSMFDKYQPSRLRLIKAKKHLQALTSDKEPMDVMKKILNSIGNPGIMGMEMGKRPPNKDAFLENSKLLIEMLNQY